MNFWRRIARFGVNENMPVFRQKSTIFFNITMRIAAFVMLILSAIMFFVLHLKFVAIGIILAVPFIILSLFLNYKGKVYLSVFVTSLFFPVYFVFLSILSKLQGEGMSIIYTVLPRLGIIIMVVISYIVLGFGDKKRAIAGAIFGFAVLVSFNYIHSLFGIEIEKLKYKPADFNILLFAIAGIFVFMIIVLTILQKINTEYEKIVIAQTEKLEEKNTEILAQKDEIEVQRDNVISQKQKIETQNKHIKSSIKYASYIQKAVLPDSKILKQKFDFFVFFEPRDIVSGDFYWFKKNENKYIVAAADCTGHGVPGAFVSLMGISFLNEIVVAKKILNPAQILNHLRAMIKNSLKQKGKIGEQKDGMDIALYVVDTKNNKLNYSGAQNPLYIVREKAKINKDELSELENSKENRIFRDKESNYVLIELKADRMPIGVYIYEKFFKNKSFNLNKSDILYSFSDGYPDQFGGTKNEKFMTVRLKKFILSIAKRNMEKQDKLMRDNFYKWKSDNEQLDDVLMLGLKYLDTV